MPVYLNLCLHRNLETTQNHSRKYKRILCWLFLRLRCCVMAMENVDIIRTIGKLSLYIYAHLQITKAAIRSCSLRQMFQSSWKILWKIPAKEFSFSKNESCKHAVFLKWTPSELLFENFSKIRIHPEVDMGPLQSIRWSCLWN